MSAKAPRLHDRLSGGGIRIAGRTPSAAGRARTLSNGARRRASGSISPLAIDELRARLAEAEDTLEAIRSGGVDALVVGTAGGPRIYALEGADHAYRVLIESMNEGALTLTADGTILYANQRFARMVGLPLEQVIGAAFQQFLSAADKAAFEPSLKRPAGSRLHLVLRAIDGTRMPAHISIRPLTRDGDERPTLGMVVTDITESRRSEEMLRALSHRLVQIDESERGRVALELHDNITQLLAAVLVRVQVLAAGLPQQDRSSRDEALHLAKLLARTAEEVERISSNLRPSVLEALGLVATLRAAGGEFVDRVGVPINLTCSPLSGRLPAEAELALYRILQEALKNIEKHARARNVSVELAEHGSSIMLSIHDDGTGFDSEAPERRDGLGLLAMRERAALVGGSLGVRSAPGTGTMIEVRVPLAPSITRAPRQGTSARREHPPRRSPRSRPPGTKKNPIAAAGDRDDGSDPIS